MAKLGHEHTPPCGQPPPPLLRTSTTQKPKFVPHSFTNLASNPSNPAVAPPTRPSSSNCFLSCEKPWRCGECPAVSTPLRRRGPQGRKTLCNACGIRYGKITKEAKQANKTNNNTNPQTMRDRNRAQSATIQQPFENEVAVRKRSGCTSKSIKRRKLERLPEGQCSNSRLSCAVTPAVSQQETGRNPDAFNNGIGMNFAAKAAVTQDMKTLTLTEDDNPTRADHLTISRRNVERLMMRTEPPVTSPPIPALFSYPREPLPNHLNLVNQVACVDTPAFFAPGECTTIDFGTRDYETENANTRENVEPRIFAGMPSPAYMYQLTPTRLEGETIQERLQYVGDDATCPYIDQNTNSNEEIPTAREMNSAILGCSQRSSSQATELMSLLGGSVGWSDHFARGYGVTVPETQENIQSGVTQQEDITSVKADAGGCQQTFGEKGRETLVMPCMETLSRLQDMSERISRDINNLSERITRFAKKNEELAVARQRNLAVIEQLTSEKTKACTKQKLLCHEIAKACSLLEHLRQ